MFYKMHRLIQFYPDSLAFYVQMPVSSHRKAAKSSILLLSLHTHELVRFGSP